MGVGWPLHDRFGAKATLVCGIAGFFSRTSRGDAQAILDSMVGRLSHRGPDGSDTRIYPLDDNGVVGLGHTLLSIIGGPSQGRQPFEVPGGTLVFNGAVYNFEELGRWLETKGQRLRTKTDTEVLALGFAIEGVAFLSKVRGMFAFAFWDSARRILTLGRDPFGVKPLYYFKDSQSFCFASEYKALIPHLRDLAINSEATADYLSLRYVPGTNTMVDGIFKLPQGSVLEFRPFDGSLKIQKYFHLTRPSHPLSEEEIYQVLETAIHRRAVSDVEVGALLSGGIDSAVACDLLERKVAGLHTYTLQTGDPSIDESGIAKMISERIGAVNTTIPPTEPSIEDLSRLAYHLDDPYGDPIILALDRIFKSISGRQKVVVTGEGADEIFAGYVHHRAAALLDRIPKNILNFGSTIARHIPPALFRHLLPYAGKLSDADYERAVRRLLSLNSSMTLAQFHAVFHLFDRDDLVVQNSNFVRGKDLQVHDDSMLDAVRDWDISHWLPDSQLFKLDKISMAASIEAREPYVDQDLIAAVTSLPTARNFSFHRDKPIFRQVVKSRVRVGSEVVNGRKTSFFQPFNRRTSAGLPDKMREIVDGKREFLRRFVSRKILDEVLASVDPGLLAQKRLFALGMLGLWDERVWDARSRGIRVGTN